jgi:hypothetical protein
LRRFVKVREVSAEKRIRQAGRTMQLDVMQGAWVSDMLLDARVVVFYRNVGERCISIRYGLQQRRSAAS